MPKVDLKKWNFDPYVDDLTESFAIKPVEGQLAVTIECDRKKIAEMLSDLVRESIESFFDGDSSTVWLDLNADGTITAEFDAPWEMNERVKLDPSPEDLRGLISVVQSNNSIHSIKELIEDLEDRPQRLERFAALRLQLRSLLAELDEVLDG